ncbi:MAG: Ig-like domain-containing protein [Eggerthellaceae bacterium]|nr:Ig-like domain-containing protein [Eggerthellaceae bacterium]
MAPRGRGGNFAGHGGFACACAGIRGNTDASGAKSNLTLESGRVRAMFDLIKGADIGLGYKSYPSTYCYVTEGKNGDTKKGKNCIQYLTPDASGYHVTYNSAPDSRKIFFVKDGYTGSEVGEAHVRNAATKVKAAQAAATVVGKVLAGGEKSESGEFDLLRGYSMHGKTDSYTVDSTTMFYYSDGLFFADPATYNDHLATLSLTAAFTGMYLRIGESDANAYRYKHIAARQFMADIGCADADIYVNESMVDKPGTDSIGVTIASKKLQRSGGADTGYTLVPIVVRGGGYEAEWASNCTLVPGAKLKLKAKIAKAKGTKVVKLAGLRYQSSAPAVATVTKKGVVKAKSKGKAKIYCYAQNGKLKTVTVKVR